MSTGTHALSGAEALPGTQSRFAGILRRAWQRMLEAQERKAAAMVRYHLSSMSDQHLADLGYGPVAIKALRKRAALGGPGWL